MRGGTCAWAAGPDVVYAFELLKYVRGRQQPVVVKTLSNYFANDDEARANGLRLLQSSARQGGVFACRIVHADGTLVTTIVSGNSAS